MKSVSFKTVGCRLNQAETTELKELFAQAGFNVKPFGSKTDAVVIHTCAVTSNAEKDCIRAARACSRREHKPFIVLAGCAAEVSYERLNSECSPDLIVGQDGKFDLPHKLANILKPSKEGAPAAPPPHPRTRAVVKVQTGCDFHCTYCIVPAARGRPKSLPEDRIVRRVQELSQQGFKEVILTGANLGCYGSSPADLVDLLKRIEQVENIERIRLSSIEMTTAEKQLVEHMRHSQKICRHLHIPLQSGCDSVLTRMNRKYSTNEYLEFCQYALETLPGLALGTDVIVGFPGETENEFEKTADFIASIPFSNMHIFQYSVRTGTPAATMKKQVPPHIKKQRSTELLTLGKQKKADFAQSLIGKKCSLLVEKIDATGRAAGWTKEYIRAEIHTDKHKINDIVDFVPARAKDGLVMTP